MSLPWLWLLPKKYRINPKPDKKSDDDNLEDRHQGLGLPCLLGSAEVDVDKKEGDDDGDELCPEHIGL